MDTDREGHGNWTIGERRHSIQVEEILAGLGDDFGKRLHELFPHSLQCLFQEWMQASAYGDCLDEFPTFPFVKVDLGS